MKRPEPPIQCKGSGNTHPHHSSGDGLGMPGTCGVCGRSVEFVKRDGDLVPKKHPPAIKPSRRTAGITHRIDARQSSQRQR
jgi:hypothetical protein